MRLMDDNKYVSSSQITPRHFRHSKRHRELLSITWSFVIRAKFKMPKCQLASRFKSLL